MGSTVSTSLSLPSPGNIHNNFILCPAKIKNTKKFGKDSTYPIVIEFNIFDNSEILSKIKKLSENNSTTEYLEVLDLGTLVKKKIFDDYPPFIYNVCFTCSRPSLLKCESRYADPTSHWFNVFYGFYEFDAPCDLWIRPFGFKTFIDNEIELIDILKMVKADWNILGNYTYGVPFDLCLKACTITGDEKLIILNKELKIGRYTYIEAIIENVICVSAYQANEQLLSPYVITSPLWRKVFGTTPYNKNYNIPFPFIRMKGHFYIRHSKEYSKILEKDVYKTWMSGGTIDMDYPDEKFNQEFLEEQLSAVKSSLENL